MTLRHDTHLGPARAREELLMKQLANVVVRGFTPTGGEDEDALRQMGYGAQVARGRVDDPQDHLGAAVRYCRDRLFGLPAREGYAFRDPVQKRWGAAWNVDPGKLRTELPLHVMKMQRALQPVA